jgi:hypothetical protein
MAIRRLPQLICLVLLTLGLNIFPAVTQDNFQDVVEMSIEVGFDSFFRPNDWTPVRVQVKNNGESVIGRLVIRPETSGTVVGNAFSTPIDLPSGAEKAEIINIQARTFPDSLRVELIDDADFVVASQEASLIDLRQQDQLYAVVTGANSDAISLAGVHIGGYEAEQAQWNIDNIPDNALSLQSLDMLVLLNIDSENLATTQRRAIRQWVEWGGHLLVIGGPSAQSTALAMTDILPFVPDDNQSIDDLTAIARYAGDTQTELMERTIIATGTVAEDAEVLITADDDTPILIRGHLGAGLIDYLVADPTLEPLASWDSLGSLWIKILATRPPQPIWTQGFTRPEWGAESIANLPGVDLLPPIQTLCLFLFAYIMLIGPVNYFVLSRLNRNGLGWITIPLVTAIFTGIAWTVGFNLRGSEIIVSRNTVVQTWADTDTAKVDQFMGVLSPRRATYSLSVPENYYLGVTGGASSGGIFASNTVQTSTEIRQATQFGADDFTIDGGIFANFIVSGAIERPDISGSATLTFDIAENGRMVGGFQGAIRNDSEITLRDAVLMGQHMVYPLSEDFAPGDIITLDRDDLTMNIGDDPAQPNSLEYHISPITLNISPFASGESGATLRDLQGERFLRTRAFLEVQSVTEKQFAREQAFLASFLIDQFDTSARGTKLYLVGWADEWSRDIDFAGANWNSVDTTLYVIEIDVEVEHPQETVHLSTEYYTWMTLNRNGITEGGTEDFNLFETQEVEFIFNPIQEFVMDEVDKLIVEVDRGGGYAQSLTVELFDWQRQEYDLFTFRDGDILEFENPDRYLGADNMVQVRLYYEQGIGTARVRKVRLTQTGRYS